MDEPESGVQRDGTGCSELPLGSELRSSRIRSVGSADGVAR